MLVIIQIDGLRLEPISYFHKIYFDRYNTFHYVSGSDRVCQPMDNNIIFHVFDVDSNHVYKFNGKELSNILSFDDFSRSSYFRYVIPKKYQVFSELFKNYDEYAEFLKHFVRQRKPSIEVKDGVVYFPSFFGRQEKVYLSCSDDKFRGVYAKFLLLSESIGISE